MENGLDRIFFLQNEIKFRVTIFFLLTEKVPLFIINGVNGSWAAHFKDVISNINIVLVSVEMREISRSLLMTEKKIKSYVIENIYR